MIYAFVSYARTDRHHVEALLGHLSPMGAQGMMRVWYDGDVVPGEDWNDKINGHLESADIFLPILTKNFFRSHPCNNEMKRAVELAKSQKIVVIPVVAEHVDWKGLLGQFQALPRDALPVQAWDNEDEAWLSVSQGVRRAVNALLSRSEDCSEQETVSSSPYPLNLPRGQMTLRRSVVDLEKSQSQHIDAIVALGNILSTWDWQKFHPWIVPDTIVLRKNKPPLIMPEKEASDIFRSLSLASAQWSLHYLAPEAIKNPLVGSEETRVFSLGMCAVFTLHGAPLPEEHRLKAPASILGRFRTSYYIRKVLLRSTASDLSHRYKTVDEFCNALHLAQVLSNFWATEYPVLAGRDDCDYLCWSRDEEGGFHTIWIRVAGDVVRREGERAGLIVGGDEQMWEWVEESRSFPMVHNDDVFGFSEKENSDRGVAYVRVPNVTLVNLLNGRQIPLNSVAELGEDAGFYSEFQTSVRPSFSIEKYLSVEEGTRGFSGGAHGFFNVAQKTVDLSTGETLDVVGDPSVKAKFPSLLEEIKTRHKDFYDFPTPFDDEEPTVEAIGLSYSGDGELVASYQFVKNVAYVDSDYQWRDYTRSGFVRSSSLPGIFEENRTIPEPLRPWLEFARHEFKVYGWTRVETSPKMTKALEITFSRG